MDIDHIASLLNEISMRLDRIPTWSASNGSRPYEYVHIEAIAMDGALEMAEEFPGFEWDIWKSIAESFQVMNATLRSNGAPELKFVEYATFLEILKEGDLPSES
ncbi:hypothetical protein DXM27_01110 [Rhizobium rhizogenes]|uniref:Uncharacterized protein n=1 Tax=Rhizobium rhizogenes TaxID=359 RepID=A0AA88F4U1_RHIRH|nr:hypothetical protein [Rhizobium rhizogenes]KAA3503938.1 hypothetical protein DXM27_01110 [Rhizobium rhizogenes]